MVKEFFCIKPGASLKVALKKLDETSEKVLIVVNDQYLLLGTLSDGDVRRFLLKGGDINSVIDPVYNSKPFSIKKNQIDNNEVRRILIVDKIGVIPIVDDSNFLVDCITNNFFFEKKERLLPKRLIDIPVVIMAGGKGTRMEPFTSVLPKPLIPIGEKTIIENIMDEFSFHGMKSFYLTLNYKAEMIEAYFKSVDLGAKISFHREKEFCGTAGSLALLKDFLSEHFIVSNCDIIVKTDYSEILDFHLENSADLTVISSIQHYKIPYGVVNFACGGNVIQMLEKPEYTFTINTGVYLLNKRCLDYIQENIFLDMTSFIETLISKGCKVLTYPVNEKDYIDVGQWEEYKKVVRQLSVVDGTKNFI